jgi:hypothetical protein
MQRTKRVVDKGVRFANVAFFYIIPYNTVRSHVHGIILGKKRGKASALVPLEETKLITYFHKMTNCEFPLTWLLLKIKVASLI